MKILVAGMRNVLRGDDGFGIRVIEVLSVNHQFPEEIDLYETGNHAARRKFGAKN